MGSFLIFDVFRGRVVSLRRGGLAEDKGVVKAPCGNCGCLMLLDAERLGIRGLWEERRGA